jgi:aminoglycoside phosphotransferase (APT) family kinase protein
LLARGRTAEIFAWRDGQVLKLFLEWCPTSWAEYEARVTRAIHEFGLPAPAVEGTVEVDGRRGIVFERVEGPSMLRELASKPWKLVPFARTLAELQAAIHARAAPALLSQREELERAIRGVAALSAPVKEAAWQALAQLPDSDALCHGDLHPDNVILSPRGPVVIDWMTAKRGNPLADVARTSLILRLGQPPPGTPGRRLIEFLRAAFHALYLRRYFQLRPGSPVAADLGQKELAAWQLPVAAARLREEIPTERERLLALVEASLPS